MGRTNLLIQIFEYLRDGESEEAAHALRHLADAVELQGSPSIEDLQDALHLIDDILSDAEDPYDDGCGEDDELDF